MGFAAAAGIDGRLFYFVPVCALFTVLIVMIFMFIVTGDVPEGVFLGIFGGLMILILILPLTLPFALGGWILARLLFWKAGVGEYIAAVLSGVIAGLCSWMFPFVIWFSVLNSGWFVPTTIETSWVPAVAGGLAAAVVYWDGWKKFAGRV
jgi:hypothetical protein